MREGKRDEEATEAGEAEEKVTGNREFLLHLCFLF